MSYQLGIDLGTTYTAAAVSRVDGSGQITTEVVSLGTRSVTLPSVLYLESDPGTESFLVGEAAQRRALTDPDRVVREFKRRIGDQTPIMVGDKPHAAEDLAARLARWVADRVTEREGEPPTRVAITHPAGWGAHKTRLFAQALDRLGLPSATLLSEPQAAAVCYAAAERIDPGATIAVYDLGGGTFDSAVVRATSSGGFELLGQPHGIDRLGGIDFDEAVFGHVLAAIRAEAHPPELDEQDPLTVSAVAGLRRECVEAKEALSADTEVIIPVMLPDVRTQVRLVRAEFESMIRPALDETIDTLRSAIGAAGLTHGDLSAVLLVGGSSRIPLVAQLVSDGLGRPVTVDADPKAVVALGAAMAVAPVPTAAQAPNAAPGPNAAFIPAGAPTPADTRRLSAGAPATTGVAAASASGAIRLLPLASLSKDMATPLDSAPTAGPPPRPTAIDAPDMLAEPQPRRRRVAPLLLAVAASIVIVIVFAGGIATVPGMSSVESAAANDTPPSISPRAGKGARSPAAASTRTQRVGYSSHYSSASSSGSRAAGKAATGTRSLSDSPAEPAAATTGSSAAPTTTPAPTGTPMPSSSDTSTPATPSPTPDTTPQESPPPAPDPAPDSTPEPAPTQVSAPAQEPDPAPATQPAPADPGPSPAGSTTAAGPGGGTPPAG